MSPSSARDKKVNRHNNPQMERYIFNPFTVFAAPIFGALEFFGSFQGIIGTTFSIPAFPQERFFSSVSRFPES